MSFLVSLLDTTSGFGNSLMAQAEELFEKVLKGALDGNVRYTICSGCTGRAGTSNVTARCD
jgi:hypothetical protein